jgi:hypothetical protein
MERELTQEIDRIMAGVHCPRGFACVESHFQRLSKVRDFGLPEYVDCLEDDPAACCYSIQFGAGYLCHCPLRVFIAKKLGR